MEDIKDGLLTNNLEALEKQAQAESDLLADVATTFIGAGIGKITISGSKIVVKKISSLIPKL